MNGIERIAAERQRQIEVEGWTPEHDDQHSKGELSRAAACYAIAASFEAGSPADVAPRMLDVLHSTWPWSASWWKPSNPVRDLEKAGALIAAEIDRRLRENTRDVLS